MCVYYLSVGAGFLLLLCFSKKAKDISARGNEEEELLLPLSALLML